MSEFDETNKLNEENKTSDTLAPSSNPSNATPSTPIPSDKKDKSKTFKIVISIAFVLIFILFVFLMTTFSKLDREGLTCMSSPFVWGARVVAEQEGGLSCTCITDSSKAFSFNEEGTSLIQDYSMGVRDE
jgi:hypothetical protein